MALLWSKTRDNTRYEVRSAGKSRRLYRNNVLHTAYNPNHPVTGSIWDLLFLPALLYPAESIQRVLLLGVGGGAAIHLLNRYLQPQTIIGVDIDKTHLSVAKRFFALQYPNTELIQADAIRWAQAYNGKPFDLLIEDIFIDRQGQPSRLMHNDSQWLKSLRRLLTPGGMLVVNNADTLESRFSKIHAGPFRLTYLFSVPQLDNRVLAFLSNSTTDTMFKENLNRHTDLTKAKRTGRLKFRMQRVAG